MGKEPCVPAEDHKYVKSHVPVLVLSMHGMRCVSWLHIALGLEPSGFGSRYRYALQMDLLSVVYKTKQSNQ